MRDPARISRVLAALELYWRRNPDLRLAQIVCNFAPFRDPYHLEDGDFLVALQAAMNDGEATPATEAQS